jgi:uncharacterized repeat protein (TIGR03803 family)
MSNTFGGPKGSIQPNSEESFVTHLTNKKQPRSQRFGALALAGFGLALLALSAEAQSTNPAPTTNVLLSVTGQIQPIYNFTGANGASPNAGLTVGPDGKFYGTTVLGGSGDQGTVFRFTLGGPLTTLFSFVYNNGSEPAGALTVGPDRNLYGTASVGGSSGNGFGTVFRITTNGTLTTLASFTGANGEYPYAGLAVDQAGNLYGNTQQGGSANDGTVFRVAANGALTTLASFTSATGNYPIYAPLIMGLDGNFYGTTQSGGNNNTGTIFKISTNGTLTTLHSFGAESYDSYSGLYFNADGAIPQAGLAVGPDGSLYGTAARAGVGENGTIFRLTTNGTFTTLASFNLTNGDFPAQLTFGPDGNLYGTATTGGSSDDGTVFKISTNGGLTVLANFTGPNGSQPFGALTLGPDGNFYGTTMHGGSAGDGLIYRLNLSPSILTGPSNQIVSAGSDVTFNVTLFGTAPFAYKWLHNSTPIVGGTNGTLSIPDAMPSNAGNYQVIVTNTWGSVTSTVATLSVMTLPPTITNQPASDTELYGGTANFVVGATGTPPLAYQWLFGSTPIANATNSTLSIPNVTLSSAGNYRVIVTNPWGSVTSSVATLSVIGVAPIITDQPTNESVLYGGTANFVVGATGTLPLAYQWLFSSIPIANATNSTLSVPNVTPSSAGNYQVIVTNPLGSVTSSVVTLSVYGVPPPAITNQPASESVLYGGTANFAVGATGIPPLAYQWLFSSVPIAGATNSTLSIPNVTPPSAGNYQVIVANPWGSVTSSVATLSVIGVAPTITSQPVNQSVRNGGTATFAVGATGSPPLTYQWYFNRHKRTEPLPGATNAILSLSPVHPDDNGTYQVIVTSPYGSVTSDAASLIVLTGQGFYAISNSVTGTKTASPGSTNGLWITNLNLPFAQWHPISTNTPAKFYILSLP